MRLQNYEFDSTVREFSPSPLNLRTESVSASSGSDIDDEKHDAASGGTATAAKENCQEKEEKTDVKTSSIDKFKKQIHCLIMNMIQTKLNLRLMVKILRKVHLLHIDDQW